MFFPKYFRDRRQLQLFLLLIASSCFDTFLVFVRFVPAQVKNSVPESPDWPEIQGIFGLAYGFLVWNLFLAWIPYLAALRLERGTASRINRLFLWSGLAVWLAFLPNAPYIVTDFIHLRHRPPVPFWYDLILLFSFASTAMTLGLLSIYEVQRVLLRTFSCRTTWFITLLSIGLAGFGVWLGRFQRWNSWDILTNPKVLVRDTLYTLLDRSELFKALGITGLVAGMLLFGYALLSTMLSHPSVANRQP